MRRLIPAVLMMWLLAACGDDSSDYPFIRGGQAVRIDASIFAVLLDVYDDQGDIFNGLCRLKVNGVTVDVPINMIEPGTDPNDPENDVECRMSLQPAPPPGTSIKVDTFVIDQAGHESNLVTLVVTFETKAGEPGGSRQLELKGGVGKLRRS